jgi:hypothetical protein
LRAIFDGLNSTFLSIVSYAVKKFMKTSTKKRQSKENSIEFTKGDESSTKAVLYGIYVAV